MAVFKDRSNYEPPPEPERRAWVHPSELGPVTPAPRRTRRGPIAAACAIAGAAVAGAVGFVILGATGTPSPRSRLGPLAQTVGLREPGTAIVTVDATTGSAPDAPSVRGSGISMGDGIIVTSAALVAAGTTVRINGTTARVVVADPYTDVAVVQTSLALDAALLAPNNSVEPDEPLMLASRTGNALGQVRTFDVALPSPSGVVIAGLIDTTFVPTRERVGSAVIDRSGSVIGLVSGASVSTAYVIPIEIVRDVVAQARRAGTVRHGSLGASVVDTAAGPTIRSVDAESPAARAGLQPGDVITAVGPQDTSTAGQLLATVRAIAPGARVTIAFLRSGRDRTATMVVAPLGS